MSENILNIIAGSILFSFIVIGFSLFIYLVAYLPSQYVCYRQATQMQMQHDFGFFTGCMIKVNGKYVPIENYRVID